MRRPVSWCQMRVRSWIESIGVSDCTPSSVSIQRRREVVEDVDLVALVGEVQRRRPAAEAVSAENRDLHGACSSCRLLRRAYTAAFVTVRRRRAMLAARARRRQSAAAVAGLRPRPADGASGGGDEAGGDDELGRVLEAHVERDDVARAARRAGSRRSGSGSSGGRR